METIKLIKHLLVAVAIMPIFAFAQDIIVMKDGSIVQSKVTEITTSEVKYKKYSNPNGPLYTIDKNTILAINYENGEKETFTAEQPSVVPVFAPQMSNETSEEAQQKNKEMITAINSYVPEYKGKDHGNARKCLFVLGVSEQSQLVNDDIEIFMETGIIDYKKSGAEFVKLGYRFKYPALVFSVRNRTNQTIYLDLGNSFFISNGEAKPYYTPSATTTSSTSGSGVGVNAGAVTEALGIGGAVGTLANGITVGGGNSSTTSTVTYSQRVMAIPPMSVRKLEAQRLFNDDSGLITKGMNLCSGGYPEVNFRTNKKEEPTQNGEVFTYSESSLPIKFSAILTYSYQENCVDTKTCSVSLYVKNAITFPENKAAMGGDNYWTCLKLGKTIPDYDKCLSFVAGIPESSGLLIVWDWNNGSLPRQ